MRKMELIIDTETTGIPQRIYGKLASPRNLPAYDHARIVQIAWIVNGNSREYTIRPESFEIKNSEIHGITQEFAENTGVDISHAFDSLTSDLKQCNLIVAHNLDFDRSIILSEAYRLNHPLYAVIKEFPGYCTMKSYNPDSYKKLTEVYRALTGVTRTQKHNALDDAEMALVIYRKLTGK